MYLHMSAELKFTTLEREQYNIVQFSGNTDE